MARSWWTPRPISPIATSCSRWWPAPPTSSRSAQGCCRARTSLPASSSTPPRSPRRPLSRSAPARPGRGTAMLAAPVGGPKVAESGQLTIVASDPARLGASSALSGCCAAGHLRRRGRRARLVDATLMLGRRPVHGEITVLAEGRRRARRFPRVPQRQRRRARPSPATSRRPKSTSIFAHLHPPGSCSRTSISASGRAGPRCGDAAGGRHRQIVQALRARRATRSISHSHRAIRAGVRPDAGARERRGGRRPRSAGERRQRRRRRRRHRATRRPPRALSEHILTQEGPRAPTARTS